MVEPYAPARGDIIWISFDPQAGHEQAKYRPAVVLSPASYNKKTSLTLVCPITSRVKGYPFEVALPSASTVTGVILADQPKSFDWKARNARFEGRASPRAVSEVLEKLQTLLGLDPGS